MFSYEDMTSGIAENSLLKLPEEPGTPRGLPGQHGGNSREQQNREHMRKKVLGDLIWGARSSLIRTLLLHKSISPFCLSHFEFRTLYFISFFFSLVTEIFLSQVLQGYFEFERLKRDKYLNSYSRILWFQEQKDTNQRMGITGKICGDGTK